VDLGTAVRVPKAVYHSGCRALNVGSFTAQSGMLPLGHCNLPIQCIQHNATLWYYGNIKQKIAYEFMMGMFLFYFF